MPLKCNQDIPTEGCFNSRSSKNRGNFFYLFRKFLNPFVAHVETIRLLNLSMIIKPRISRRNGKTKIRLQEGLTRLEIIAGRSEELDFRSVAMKMN